MVKIKSFAYCAISACIMFFNCTNSPKPEKSHNPIYDTNYVWILHDSSYKYVYHNPLLAMKFAQQEKKLARDLNYKKGIIRSLSDVGNVLWITGSYPDALETHLEALRNCDSVNDQDLMAKCLGNMGIVYRDMGQNRQAIKYTNEAVKLDLACGDKKHLLLDYMNLGEFYDSVDANKSIEFLDRAEEMARAEKNNEVLARLMLDRGNYNVIDKNPIVAMSFYKTSINLLEAVRDYHSLSQSYLAMAMMFKCELKKRDSAFQYASLALKTAMLNDYPLGRVNAQLFLYDFYKNVFKDSALTYLEAAGLSRDSMYGVEHVIRAQDVDIKTQAIKELRKKIKEEEEKRTMQYLQFAKITGFIFIVFVVVVFLAKIKLRRWIIESLGLFVLLLFFEFITLLIHYTLELEGITDEQPILMFVFLVIAAAALVPIHHKAQHWLMDKLLKHSPTIEPDFDDD